MLFALYFLFVILVKIILYLTLLLLVAAICLRLWVEPVKGVCKCTTNLQGRVALVTGGNSGIGRETVRNLARRGARVIIACRDAKKSQEVITDIIETTGNTNIEYRNLDLSKFSSVRKFAEDFNKTVDRLDILVNNAGAGGLKHKITEDGIDLTMQINYLGAFLLTNLLLDKLVASRPSRIVVVSSYGHNFAQFDPEDLVGHKTTSSSMRYANSKLCQVLWTKALANKLPDGVTVNALHPGIVQTEIFNKLYDFIKKIVTIILKLVFKTAKEGAQTSVHLCVAPELVNASGGYYSDCKPCKASKLTQDADLIEKVWKESTLLTEKYS